MNATIVNAFALYSGNLVAGGVISTASGESMRNITQFNGVSWLPFVGSSGNPGVSAEVHALTVHGGNLIVGGRFASAGSHVVFGGGLTVNHITRWNGADWNAYVSGGQTGVNQPVRALTVYDGDLYAGGLFTTAGGLGAKSVARWDGSAWNLLGGGMTGPVSPSVNCFGHYNGDLLAGGSFNNVDGIATEGIARWNGAAWQALGTGLPQGNALALAVYNNTLYVGGGFSSINAVLFRSVATWTDCAPAMPGDVNGDGVVNIADLLAVIAAWGPCLPPCPADVNGDLVVNIADLLIVIANWG
jgi:hypothetical protein